MMQQKTQQNLQIWPNVSTYNKFIIRSAWRCSPIIKFSLGPTLYLDLDNVRSTDNKSSCINLVINNIKIFYNVLLLKEVIDINETKPTLNTGLRKCNCFNVLKVIHYFHIVDPIDIYQWTLTCLLTCLLTCTDFLTNKSFSRNSNYIADVIMRPTFGNSISMREVSMREVIIISTL